MLSVAQIVEMSDEQARKAARQHKQPYIPWNAAEVDSYPPFPFPNIGSYRPKGWELVEDWLCDSFGFGLPTEPALTIDQLKARIKERIAENGHLGFAIIQEGEFQIVLGVFNRTKPAGT
jgi:hypothetical protein